MMPSETLKSSPNGAPMAMALRPTSSWSLLPSGRGLISLAGTPSTRMSARSKSGARATTRALYPLVLPCRCTVISLAPSTTWLFVMMSPPDVTKKPLPVAVAP